MSAAVMPNNPSSDTKENRMVKDVGILPVFECKPIDLGSIQAFCHHETAATEIGNVGVEGLWDRPERAVSPPVVPRSARRRWAPPSR